jgi:hypothetical protein
MGIPSRAGNTTRAVTLENLSNLQRGNAQSCFWRRNPTKTLGFLLPWFSPWLFVGFLLSPPPYAQSFPRKPSVLVLAFGFFPWFLKSKQLLGFLGVVCMLKQGPNRNITFYINVIKIKYSIEAIQACQ